LISSDTAVESADSWIRCLSSASKVRGLRFALRLEKELKTR